jgi:hypothetical protein
MKGKMRMTKFEFIDVEAVWDEHLHEAYREIDPRGAAKQKRNDTHRHRIPCKRVIAAAAFSIEVDEGGAISIAGLKSWTKHEHGDEREVVTNLFAHLRERPDARVVTYSGLAAEVPLLTLAAMEYELALPDQLRTGLPVFNRPGTWRPHIDLALELKGQGRDWAHLSELGLRLGLPSALFTGKPDIEQPVSGEQWQALRQRVTMDCVITAVVALAFWRANGRVVIDQIAMIHNIADWSLRNGIAADAPSGSLIQLREQMFEMLTAEQDKAA